MPRTWPGSSRAEETRQVRVTQVGCRAAQSLMQNEPCDAAARGDFKEGPGQVPYSTVTSKTLVLLSPGNISG